MNIHYIQYPPPQSSMTPRDTAGITYAIVHHGDNAANTTPMQIDQEHRAQGWAMIGYNWVIGCNGTVFKGRPDNYWPAAAEGLNEQSIDICLTGDFQPGTPGFQASVPPAQLQALKDLLVYVHRQYVTITQTIGHRDVDAIAGVPSDATACPGDVLYNLLPDIRSYVATRLK